MNRYAWLVFGLLALSSFAQAAPRGIFPTRQFDRYLKTHFPHHRDAQGLVYYGGPVISNVKAYAVMWGNKVDATVQKQIGGMLTATVNSTHMDWLNEYNTNINSVSGQPGSNQKIGRGTFGGQIMINPTHTGNHLDDKDVQAEIGHQISIHALPVPDANTIYIVYFPPGISITNGGMTSCQAFCAYHEGFVANNKQSIFYAVMPDLGGSCSLGCGFGHSRFDEMTEVTAHELIEAVTDPFPTPGDKPAFPQAWNTTDGQEIGDLCAGKGTRLSTNGLTYILQQEYDNKTNSCAPGPYQSP